MSDAALRRAAATFLRDHENLRMPMHGRSMAPLLVEPMVLQIGAAKRVRIGDVIVFRKGTVHVAHRVVRLNHGSYDTAGDAQPRVVERVGYEQVVGRVIAIWSDASSDARRVDTWTFQARSWCLARFHSLRTALHVARDGSAGLRERFFPQCRTRFAAPLVEALRAAQSRDSAGLTAALGHSLKFTPANDARHRCAALLGETARRLDIVDALPADVARTLRSARLNAIMGTSRMHCAVAKSITILQLAGIEFALLKGAARMYDGSPDAAYHPSDDIDILVRSDHVDAAVTAFLRNGWHQHESVAEIKRFRRAHHHAASLFPPEGDYPVEIHHALAMSDHLSIATDWRALQAFFVPLTSGSRACWRLDAVGTALHLAVHAIGLTRLRDVALLARLLPTLSLSQKQILRQMIARERRDPVRLAAPLVLAAYVAGIPWPSDRQITRYIRWALRRKDLPNGMRTRSDAAEIYFARPNVPWRALTELVPWWSRGAQRYAIPGRVLARCSSNAAALIYANMLPAAGPKGFS